MAAVKDEREVRLAAAQKQLTWALKSEAAPRLNAMVELARSEPGIPVLPEQLDKNPWLFNCPNGTLELDTGRLREHRREDYITKLCPTPYDPRATCPTWERLLESVFPSDDGAPDRELITFVQRLLGRCLSGDVSEQILAIFWGVGANGKTTLLNGVLETVGTDYTMKAAPNLLMSSKSERHPTERADLFGMRLVVVSETPEDRHLNEAFVKDLTGRERIRARRMREDFWEFDPTHKVILQTNHRPVIRGTDEGIWRRLRLVPFEVRFWDPDEPRAGKDVDPRLMQDKRLPDKLRAEYPGIPRPPGVAGARLSRLAAGRADAAEEGQGGHDGVPARRGFTCALAGGVLRHGRSCVPLPSVGVVRLFQQVV
jgi:putative DNA primase/helicase